MTKRPTRAELEDAATTAMLRVFDKVQRHRRLVRDYGTGYQLTTVEATVCHLIGSTKGISPSELAERIGVTRPAVSQALNRLRTHGLITVETPPDNGKARVVRVTETGAMVAREVTELRRRMSRAVYTGTHDLQVFLGLFERLDAFFAEVIAESGPDTRSS